MLDWLVKVFYFDEKGLKWMRKEKWKHGILIVVAVCLIGIGYLNYDYEQAVEVASLNQVTNESSLRRCAIGK